MRNNKTNSQRYSKNKVTAAGDSLDNTVSIKRGMEGTVVVGKDVTQYQQCQQVQFLLCTESRNTHNCSSSTDSQGSSSRDGRNTYSNIRSSCLR